MTPKEFLRFESIQNAIIDRARKRICNAREEANKSGFPDRFRKAKPDDIVDGAIIWHRNGEEHYWNICFGSRDGGKAYLADDGCIYWIDNAFVEVA